MDEGRESFVVFAPALLAPEGQTESAWWFIFSGDELLVSSVGTDSSIPYSTGVSGLKQSLLRTHYIGAFSGTPCYAAEASAGVNVPEGMFFQKLRPLLGALGEEIFSIAGRAYQIIDWDRTHQFCGRCGNHTEPKAGERAKACPSCGLISYPEVSPAIIVAVTRSAEILLARSRRFHGSYYSILAGFVEPGETFEECVKREVKEEVGIEVDNISYFGSQPWPFPHSLMAGFTAEHADGEIAIDETEITAAGWFTAEALPHTPPAGTMAQRLIKWFCEKSQQKLVYP